MVLVSIWYHNLRLWPIELLLVSLDLLKFVCNLRNHLCYPSLHCLWTWLGILLTSQWRNVKARSYLLRTPIEIAIKYHLSLAWTALKLLCLGILHDHKILLHFVSLNSINRIQIFLDHSHIRLRSRNIRLVVLNIIGEVGYVRTLWLLCRLVLCVVWIAVIKDLKLVARVGAWGFTIWIVVWYYWAYTLVFGILVDRFLAQIYGIGAVFLYNETRRPATALIILIKLNRHLFILK